MFEPGVSSCCRGPLAPSGFARTVKSRQLAAFLLVLVSQFPPHHGCTAAGSASSPEPLRGFLDGLNLAPDLLGGQAVQPALPCDHQDGEQQRQDQDHGLEPPKEVLLHDGGAAAGGGVREADIHSQRDYTSLEPLKDWRQ